IKTMSNITNNSTNQTSQPSLSQHTIDDIIAHVIDGGNPFTEMQSTSNQTASPQNTQFSDTLFSGTSFVQHE
ncbi:15225_t:CDS:1, partial [Racocetra persica]